MTETGTGWQKSSSRGWLGDILLAVGYGVAIGLLLLGGGTYYCVDGDYQGCRTWSAAPTQTVCPMVFRVHDVGLGLLTVGAIGLVTLIITSIVRRHREV